MSKFEELITLLHEGRDPYDGFPYQQWTGKWQSWGSEHPWFHEQIDSIRPKVIIEVGSFLGASAIHMSRKIQELRLDSAIICVDTWLGGIDHWTKARELLGSWFGRPDIYYRFLSNVMENGQKNFIVPIPIDSLNGARILTAKSIVADMVYVDGSHEEEDVINDLEAYWPLLRSGGVLMIDDLTGYFPGVCQAWRSFMKRKSDQISHINQHAEKGLVIKA